MKLMIEEDEEGFISLIGKNILIVTSEYFYGGILEGVNDTCVKLRDTSIVYSSGSWSDTMTKDTKRFKADFWYVQRCLIESFGLAKNT